MPKTRVHVVPDFEGDYDLLLEYLGSPVEYGADADGGVFYVDIEQSTKLTIGGDIKIAAPKLVMYHPERDMVVFLGDIMDVKKSNLKCLLLVLQLKHDYPDNCVLIAGNRDVNKYCFPLEVLFMTLDQFCRCRWWGAEYLRYLQDKKTEDSFYARLAFTCAKTKGAPNLMANIAEECGFQTVEQLVESSLAVEQDARWEINYASGAPIISPFSWEGAIHEYLKNTHLMYYWAEGMTLFTHSVLTNECVEKYFSKSDNVLENVLSMNQMYQDYVVAAHQLCTDIDSRVAQTPNARHSSCMTDAEYQTYETFVRPMIQFVEPDIIPNPKYAGETMWDDKNTASLVASKAWSKEMDGLSFDRSAYEKYLPRVHTFVCGHIPIGSMPFCVKVDPANPMCRQHVIMCDTTKAVTRHARITLWMYDGTAGSAPSDKTFQHSRSLCTSDLGTVQGGDAFNKLYVTLAGYNGGDKPLVVKEIAPDQVDARKMVSVRKLMFKDAQLWSSRVQFETLQQGVVTFGTRDVRGDPYDVDLYVGFSKQQAGAYTFCGTAYYGVRISTPTTA